MSSFRTMFRVAFSAIVFMTLQGCSSEPAVIPTSYQNYTSSDETFACDAPEGWEIKGGGKNGPVWARFTSGPADISLKVGIAGSLMSDAMSGLTNSPSGAAPQIEPVDIIHQNALKEAEQEYDGYAETVGSPAKLQCQLGPARVSEFTAKTAFGSGIHGYRATIIGHERAVTVFCTCPEDEWAALRPAFDKVLTSLKRG